MKTVKVTFEVSEERILEAFRGIAEQMNLKLVDNIDFNKVGLEFSEDVVNYVTNDLEQFIEEGWNNDVYKDFFEEDVEEDEDEDEESVWGISEDLSDEQEEFEVGMKVEVIDSSNCCNEVGDLGVIVEVSEYGLIRVHVEGRDNTGNWMSTNQVIKKL